MATNQTIESPAFDAIKAGDKIALTNAIRLLWYVANNEAASRRQGLSVVNSREVRRVKSDSPTTNQNNYPTEGAGILYFIGSTSFNLTGLLGTGEEGERITIHNEGTGTISILHNSASSDPDNRFTNASGGTVTVATGKTYFAHKLGGKWRQVSLA